MSHQTIITKLQKIIDKTIIDTEELNKQTVVTGDMQGDFERLLKKEFLHGYRQSIMDISEIIVNENKLQTTILRLQKLTDKSKIDLEELNKQTVVTGDMQGDFERLLKQEFLHGYMQSITDISEIVVNDYNQLDNQTHKIKIGKRSKTMTEYKTSYENRCIVLHDLWSDFKDHPQFAEFVEYNDLGLPLAYMINSNIIASTPIAETYINESFDLLCEAMELDSSDVEVEGIDDLFELRDELHE